MLPPGPIIALSRSVSKLRLAVLMAACMAVPVTLVQGQETALNYVRPNVNQEQFMALGKQVGLDREQRMVTDLLYNDYTAGITVLVTRVDRTAIAAGRMQVEDAFAGRTSIDAHLFSRMRRDVLATYTSVAAESSQLLDTLLLGVESQLLESQQAEFPAALRALHRSIYLHPRHITGTSFTYAGEGVDVLLLATAAASQGNELGTVDPDALGAILMQYELELDAVLVEQGNRPERASLDLRINRVGQDVEGIATAQNTLIDAWAAVYQLNRRTVDAIAALAAETEGDWARNLWLDRFDRASFGWMFEDKQPDRQIAWMRGQEIAADAHQEAELAYGIYLAERSTLAREAIVIIVKGRTTERAILTPYLPPQQATGAARQMYQELLKNSGAFSNLESRVSGQLEALLDEEARKAMRQAIRQRRR